MPPLARLRIAHSPDADDAFMFFGVTSGAVDPAPLELVLEEADVQTLNDRARAGELDVTAISFAAWPRFAELYDLCPVGSSFGLGYGPRVVARERIELRALKGPVAIPGEGTTAALLLRLAVPGVETRVLPFEEIPRAVSAGEVPAGVVIHEGQLVHERQGLALVADLGAWWSDATGGLPVPLGANAIRRGLPSDVVAAFSRVMRASIAHALAHREDAIRASLKPERGLTWEEGLKYIAMYVNELSLDPGPEGRASVVDLYDRAALSGLLPSIEPRWA